MNRVPMVLISCPECKRMVSDKALSCPGCGHPLQENRSLSLSNFLLGLHWQARTHTLPGGGIAIKFMDNGRFIGQLAEGYNLPAQQVNGKWQVIESQLFLDFDYVYVMGPPMQRIPSSVQIQIQFTQVSLNKILGVDQFARAWEWERIESVK